MQIPQYERRPREIPTYKPLQENWRFANPYPSSIEVGRAPVGEALGAIGSGLLGLRNKLLEMEDATYLNVQAPKMYVATQEIFAKYDEFADPKSEDYATGRIAFYNQEIQKYKDNPSSGYDKSKTAQNAEMDEKIQHAYIYPQLKADYTTQATARADYAKKSTQVSVNTYYDIFTFDQQKRLSPNMQGQGNIPENSAEVPGSIGYTMKNMIAAGERSIMYAKRNGLITPEVSDKMSDAHYAQSYITSWNNVKNSVAEFFAFAEAELQKDNPNMAAVRQAYKNANTLLVQYENNFHGHAFVIGATAGDNPVIQIQAAYNEDREQLEKRVYNMEKKGEKEGVQAHVIDNSILSTEKRQEIVDGINSERDKLTRFSANFYKTKPAKKTTIKYPLSPNTGNAGKMDTREAVRKGLERMQSTQGGHFVPNPEYKRFGI